jgi:site-specific DNA-methyltransferase (adenine-specific)
MNPVTIGRAQLYLGDCRDILPALPLSTFTGIVTDPPYGIGFRYGTHKDRGGEEYVALMGALKGHPRVVLQYPREMMELLVPSWGAPNDTYLWCYNSNLPRQSRIWGFWSCEPDFNALRFPPKNAVAKVRSESVRSYDWCSDINLVKGNANDKTEHPCQLPVELARRVIILSAFSKVADPFMGSGTVGVACTALGIPFVGIEKDPAYFEIAVKRIEDAQRQGDFFVEAAA